MLPRGVCSEARLAIAVQIKEDGPARPNATRENARWLRRPAAEDRCGPVLAAALGPVTVDLVVTFSDRRETSDPTYARSGSRNVKKAGSPPGRKGAPLTALLQHHEVLRIPQPSTLHAIPAGDNG